MEPSDCTDSVSVSSPMFELTLNEAIGTILLTTTHGWFNHYVFNRWLKGYKNTNTQYDIYLPRCGHMNEREFNVLVSKCRELSKYYNACEQERIWKWAHSHQKSK